MSCARKTRGPPHTCNNMRCGCNLRKNIQSELPTNASTVRPQRPSTPQRKWQRPSECTTTQHFQEQLDHLRTSASTLRCYSNNRQMYEMLHTAKGQSYCLPHANASQLTTEQSDALLKATQNPRCRGNPKRSDAQQGPPPRAIAVAMIHIAANTDSTGRSMQSLHGPAHEPPHDTDRSPNLPYTILRSCCRLARQNKQPRNHRVGQCTACSSVTVISQRHQGSYQLPHTMRGWPHHMAGQGQVPTNGFIMPVWKNQRWLRQALGCPPAGAADTGVGSPTASK
jgi:hypothetical protein